MGKRTSPLASVIERRGLILLGTFLLLLTVILSPWRNSAPQDDGTYAFSAIQLAESGGPIHKGTIAMNLPQYALGVSLIKLFPNVPPLVLLNFMSWCLFAATVVLFYIFSGIHPLLLVGFFSFPLWVQYGTIFHYEIYAIFLLVLLMGLTGCDRPLRSTRLHLVLLFLLSFLLGTQLQNMAAFPFFWGLGLIIGSEERKSWGFALIGGSVAAVLAFALMPKTPYQAAYTYWMTKTWIDMGASIPFQFLGRLLRMISAFGLFLLPLVHYKKRSVIEWIVGASLHAVIFAVIYFADLGIFSAGILFTDYYPPIVSTFLNSLGIWGFWGLYPLFRRRIQTTDPLPILGSLVALAVIAVFCTYRFAVDLRYVMSWSLVVLFHFRGQLKNPIGVLGKTVLYIVPTLSVSIFLNLYLLNTTDARWQVAAELEKQGAAKKEIAAGYGWSSFMISNDCMVRILEKLRPESREDIYKDEEFFRRFINLYGRNYEDEWVPRFIIKPSRVFGYQLNLNRWRLPGQENEPIRLVDYSVLGIPSQLAVFENQEPKPAWCDKPD